MPPTVFHQPVRHGFQFPQLVLARNILPDLGLGTVFYPHAHQVNDFIGQHVAQFYLAAAGLHNLPALACAGGLAPLVNPGAVGYAGHGQIHDLAGKAVFDAVFALARFLKPPLLPGLALIAPQTHRSAVLGIEIGTSNTRPFAAAMV